MSIRIVENEKPVLPQCQMMCDTKLHDKLDNYDVTSFLNNHSTTLFIGKPKSGKTSLLYSFFKSKKLFNKVYDKIFIFQPSASRASMKDQLFNKLPDDQIYEELTLENLNDAESKLNPDGNNVMIFDDQTAYLKDKNNLKKLKSLVFNRRHLHLSIFFLVQTYYSVPKDIRKLFSNIFIFKVSKNEMATIFDEVIEHSMDLVLPIVKLVYDQPYQWLFVNTDSQRMFKCFDELIFDEE